MKKIASFMVALLCVISLSVFLSSCGKPKPVSIGIKDNTLDTELFVGESLNLDDVVLIVTYDNKKTEEVAKNDDMQFSNVDTSVAGQKVLTITYLDLTTTITIIVSEPTAQSIAVKQGTLQTTVTQGLDLDLSNLTLVVSYNDGSVQEVAYSTQMEIAGFDNTQLGDQLITISYLGLTTTYEIEVVAPVVTGIEIKQGTIIDEIYQGKTLDLSNAVLIVSYNNNTKIEVEYNSDMIFKGVDANNFGQQTLEVEYLGFSAQMTINVIELKETGITLIPGTLKTDLEADERLDTSTVKLLVTFNSGDAKEVTVSDGITFSEVDTSTPGAKQLTIYYKGLSISVAITVANPVAESIALKQGTLETTVTQGLDVDTSKVVIIVTYNTGDKIEVSDLSQIEFSNVDTSQIGKTTMTIIYAGLQMQVEIDVVAPVLESIAIKDGTLKTQVYQEEQLDFSTVVLVLYYNNNTSDEVAYNGQMKFEGVDTASYGEQTLTITYLDKQVDVKINVIKLEVVDITVKEGTLAQTVFVNGTLDTTNVVLTVEYNSGKTEEVSAQSGKISFSTLDTSSAGEKALNITYGDFSKSLTILVVEPMPTNISLVEGTLDTTIYEGEQLVLDNVKLEVVFEDESVKTIAKNDDMAFSKIDTSKAGQEILTITYKGVSVDVVITIEEKLPEYTVTSFELPEFATKFSTNAQAYNLKNNTYKVGDDNAFIFKPTIKGFQMVGGEMGEISQIDYIPSTFKVEQKSDGQYTELVGESLTNIVTIDEKKYAFDFDATAIGNTYKITISANIINGEKSVNFETLNLKLLMDTTFSQKQNFL